MGSSKRFDDEHNQNHDMRMMNHMHALLWRRNPRADHTRCRHRMLDVCPSSSIVFRSFVIASAACCVGCAPTVHSRDKYGKQNFFSECVVMGGFLRFLLNVGTTPSKHLGRGSKRPAVRTTCRFPFRIEVDVDHLSVGSMTFFVDRRCSHQIRTLCSKTAANKVDGNYLY